MFLKSLGKATASDSHFLTLVSRSHLLLGCAYHTTSCFFKPSTGRRTCPPIPQLSAPNHHNRATDAEPGTQRTTTVKVTVTVKERVTLGISDHTLV